MSVSRAKLVIVGQGYVGLPIAMRAVQSGYAVVGLDVNTQRVAQLAKGESYVEDVSDQTLADALSSGRYVPTAEIAGVADFDFAIITVPTPLRETLPDLSFIEDAARGLASYLRVGATVVLESTTYPGTTEELLVPILEAGSGLKASVDFFVGYSPERIDPGNKIYKFENTPKVVSGLGSSSLQRIVALYESLVDTVVPVSSPREAELTKLLENTFRHVNIALVNELAVFAKDLGIDVWEAIDAASTKPFGYMRFTPGPGVGGHCLPVDPSYLSWQVRRTLGHSFRFVELANDINEHMPDYVVQRVADALNERSRSIRGSTIALVGLSYKANTGDARESPSLRIASLLHDRGAHLVGLDSHVTVREVPEYLRLVPQSELQDVEAVVILTDHDDVDYSAIQSLSCAVLDTRNRLGGRVPGL